MHRVRALPVAALLALLAAPVVAGAQAVQLTANLTHDQETGVAGTTPTLTSTGAPRPLSFGTATLLLNAARTELSWTATIFNIDVTGTQTTDTFDNLTLAHIHGPALPGAAAGVIWGFFGTPDNDVAPSDLVVTPFATGVGGTFSSVWNLNEGNNTTLTAQLPNILEGRTYLNFHTVQFPGGEIRGQIQVVPEPSTYLLMATGMAALGLVAWRRRA
jgi:hypothetical protein